MPLSHYFEDLNKLCETIQANYPFRQHSAEQHPAGRHPAGRHPADKIGFLAGEFDLYHAGHRFVLEAAQSQCDILILALSSDEALTEKYGHYRPLCTFNERAETLLATRYVDYVVPLMGSLSTIIEQLHLGVAQQGGIQNVGPPQMINLTNNAHILEVDIDELTATNYAISQINSKLYLDGVPPTITSGHRSAEQYSIEQRSTERNSAPMDYAGYQPQWGSNNQRVVKGADLSGVIEQWHALKTPLITTNGSFDLLHPGHLRYLKQAKSLGGRFLVLVNDDQSIKASKGVQRPIFSQQERMQTLASFSFIDHVIPFSGDNPLYMLDQIKPQIHVKGGSYELERIAQEKELVEAHGGRFQHFELTEGYSSTQLLERAKCLYNNV